MNSARRDNGLRVAVLGTRGIPGVMGGVESHCEELYPRLAERGHSVTLFARRGYVESPHETDYRGVRVVPSWAPRKKCLEAICHTAAGVLLANLRRGRFDLLHIHAIGPSLLAPVARALGFRVVMTHHGPDYDRQKWGPYAKRVLRLGEQLGCGYANRVIAVSRHIAGSVHTMYGCDSRYVPNGVPLKTFLPPGRAMEKWGLTPRRYMLAVGRFVPEKGFHDLIEAFRDTDTDWRLVIAGAADHEDDYSRSIAESAERDPRVVLTGFIKGDELGEVLSNAGVFVMPSYHEGLPIAMLEAMSYDLPVIASRIPANMELIQDGESFVPGDIPKLREIIQRFADSPWPAALGREYVAREYDWERVTELTESVYREAVAA